MGILAAAVVRRSREVERMATAPKRTANMAKKLTVLERNTRAAAEAETMPERTAVKLIPPPYVKKDRLARAYWDATIRRMEGLTLLDDLDSEMLGIYCSALSRRDEMNALCLRVLKEAKKQKPDAEALLETVSKLDTLTGKLQRQETQLLQYADKLGLTPSGRVRLAQKRAEARAVDGDDDLFG